MFLHRMAYEISVIQLFLRRRGIVCLTFSSILNCLINRTFINADFHAIANFQNHSVALVTYLLYLAVNTACGYHLIAILQRFSELANLFLFFRLWE